MTDDGKTGPSRPSRLGRRRAKAAAAVVLATLLSLAVAWTTGERFQGLELPIHDRLLRLLPAGEPRTPPVVVAGIDEADIQSGRFGASATDKQLTDLLELLLRQEPLAIGLDIYRDVTVGGDDDAHDKLVDLIRRDRRLIVIAKAGEDPGSFEVAPPKRIDGETIDPSQVGLSHFPLDTDYICRRASLRTWVGPGDDDVYLTLTCRLAVRALERHGLTAETVLADPDYYQFGKTRLRRLDSRFGGWTDTPDQFGDFQVPLDFVRGKWPATYSAGALLSGKAPMPDLKNRIVIVGVTAPSVDDTVRIPVAAEPVRGTELHARIVDQLLRIGLDGVQPISSWPQWAEHCWSAAWVLLAATVCILTLRRLRGAVTLFSISVVLGLAVLVLAGWLFLAVGRTWVPVAPAAVGWLIGCASVGAVTHWRERADRRAITGMFDQFASQEVVRAIWSRRDELDEQGRLRPRFIDVTTLFTDLEGFTSVLERVEPRIAIEWLDGYAARMTMTVLTYRGTVIKSTGDGLMAAFGAPESRGAEAEACAAVECALAMREALRELHRIWRATADLPEIAQRARMRVGIFSGAAVECTLGSRRRMHYDLHGNSVNTASRLESFDKERRVTPDEDCRILVGEPTVRLLGDRFEIRHVADEVLKGHERPVAIYVVVGRRTDQASAPDSGAPMAPALDTAAASV